MHWHSYPPKVLMQSCSHPCSWALVHSSYSRNSERNGLEKYKFQIKIIKYHECEWMWSTLIINTLHKCCGKSRFLHWAIGHEFDPQLIASRFYILWHLIIRKLVKGIIFQGWSGWIDIFKYVMNSYFEFDRFTLYPQNAPIFGAFSSPPSLISM